MIVCTTSPVSTAGSLPVTLKYGDDSVLELDDQFVYTENPIIINVRPLAAFYRFHFICHHIISLTLNGRTVSKLEQTSLSRKSRC